MSFVYFSVLTIRDLFSLSALLISAFVRPPRTIARCGRCGPAFQTRTAEPRETFQPIKAIQPLFPHSGDSIPHSRIARSGKPLRRREAATLLAVRYIRRHPGLQIYGIRSGPNLPSSLRNYRRVIGHTGKIQYFYLNYFQNSKLIIICNCQTDKRNTGNRRLSTAQKRCSFSEPKPGYKNLEI